MATSIALPGQTLSTLVNFNGTNGAAPQHMTLIQGTDGNLWGTTDGGGANGMGTVFKVTTSGALTTLHSFTGADGATPYAGLVQATNGYFYGTTEVGGAHGYGTIFKITVGGALTPRFSFNSANGANPAAAMVQATNGNLYGTTYLGGANCSSSGCGTIFKITPNVKFTNLYSFAAIDGANPWGPLVEANNGALYGTTVTGSSAYGTVFKMTLAGAVTPVYTFDGTGGQYPYAGLLQAADGNLYGTTFSSGATGSPYGTIFKITPAGKLTTLHAFNAADGANPYAGVVQATDGNFYGTTYNGGANGYGTVYRITTAGVISTLYSFDLHDGANPVGGLVQATDGNLYGTTSTGGDSGNGTIFAVTTGLGPFVKTLPVSGSVGAAVKILGSNLTGTTAVTFDGVAAVFTVVSPTVITTTVPAGATTGKVQVVTPVGTLASDVVYRVH